MANAYISIKFVKQPVAVGKVVHERRSDEMKFVIDALRAGKPTHIEQKTSSKALKREEVLALEGGVPSKLRTSLLEDESIHVANGQTTKVSDPFLGRTFVLEKLADGRVIALTGEGAPALLSEETQILERYGKIIGRPDPLQYALPDDDVSVGTHIPAIAAAIKDRLLEKNKRFVIEGADAWLAEIRDQDGARLGIIQFTMRASQSGNPAALAIDLNGTMSVRASDAAVLAIDIEAPISVVDAKQPNQWKLTKMKGQGKMISKVSYTYA